MYDNTLDSSVKQALAAVGAIPISRKQQRPMFGKLVSYIARFTMYGFLVLFVFCIGAVVGAIENDKIARERYMTEGLKSGITFTLTEAQKRGYGIWIAQTGEDGVTPETRFLWRDDAEAVLNPKRDFHFNPMQPQDNVKQIGEPDAADRGVSTTRPRVTLCGALEWIPPSEPSNQRRESSQSPSKDCRTDGMVCALTFIAIIFLVMSAVQMAFNAFMRKRKGTK